MRLLLEAVLLEGVLLDADLLARGRAPAGF